ncbi:MAG: fibronectin type III domain-containing protein [Chloroflexi bacterium]|nr:fibronectin type III domain-containing protein [Chloroflexota bacterium]
MTPYLTPPPTPAATAPGAATGVTAAAGDGQASVSWAAPASDGGSPITSYTVTSSPGGLTATTAGATSATVTGLANDTSYTFTVSAANAVGTGPSSDPSAPVTPQAGAAAPQTTTETVPASTGGTATTDPTNSGPTPSDPITTSVTVPPTSDGGTISIAETAVTESAPAGGYQFLGQQIDITSTAATSASNPLTIVFTIDSSAIRTSLGLAPSDPLPTADQVAITRAEAGSPVVVETCTVSAPPIAPDPCVSDRQYINAGDDLRITILTGSASHWNSAVKTTAVSVADNGYSPKTVTVGQGGIVVWTFAGSKPHSVTENLKLGPAKSPLFNSGVLTSGRSGYVFRAAATYTYGSTVKGDPGSFAGSVAVPVVTSPTSGGTTTSFTITWSSAALTGYVFDVQYRFMKAGSKTWSALKTWKTGVATTSAAFNPSSGKGTYAFSARLRNSGTGISAQWSPEATFIVR